MSKSRKRPEIPRNPRPIQKQEPSNAPKGRLRYVLAGPPPGIVVDRYKVLDLRTYKETNEEPDIITHPVEVWTTRRDKLIDTWLDAERILRTACVLLLSPTVELRARVWTLMERQSGDALIDLLGDLLNAKSHTPPDDFRNHLKLLAKLRNLLAHQSSRPRESKLSDGLVFLKSTGFKKGLYVEVAYSRIDQAIAAVEPFMKWLVAELPEVDHVGVQMEDEVFDMLEGRQA